MMRVTGLASVVLGFGMWAVGCAQSGDQGASAPDSAAGAETSGDESGAGACTPCVSDGECGSGSCVQVGADSYCAPACAAGDVCSGTLQCEPASSSAGVQVSVCLPSSGPCAGSISPLPDAGSARPDATTSPDGGPTTAPDGGPQTCGTLVNPPTPSTCKCNSALHTCAPNGCFGGWWCDTATSRCQPAPSCVSSGTLDGGSDGDAVTPPPRDSGPPPVGSVGSTGGKVSSLLFAVVGDTRPPVIDDTKAYPTAIISKIYQDIAALSPMPPFVVSTGDYQFSRPSGAQATIQIGYYMTARAAYSGAWFPAMGNHECTGATNSNCGPGGKDGTPNNYTSFVNQMLSPIGQTSPYYSIRVDSIDGSWTSKFVFVAGNAWDTAQETWLDATLAVPTTYTFVLRHEPAAATTAPGVRPSEAVMAKYPYTLAITGHTHLYARKSQREIVVGNGGAPLTSSSNYGFGLISQRADGAIQVQMIDYASGAADSSFGFALRPDGSAAP
jgi:hypothetical protein